MMALATRLATPMLLLAAALPAVRGQEAVEPGRLSPAYDPRSTPLVQVIRRVRPAVVHIEARWVAIDFSKRTGAMTGSLPRTAYATHASGVVIGEDGYILTNYHVVANAVADDKNGRILVSFDPRQDPTEYEAQFISDSYDDDLALIKISGERKFPEVVLGSSSDLMLGEPVVIIGNPRGNWHSVSQGIVSGIDRRIRTPVASHTDLIQTDAAINKGNSGGPLLNIHGELIGLCTSYLEEAVNLGYAIPVDRVKEVLRESLLTPSAAQSWLGFEVDLLPGGEGPEATIVVTHVTRDGPAWLSGLRAGFQVLQAGGEPILDVQQFNHQRLQLQPGDVYPLRVNCSGQEQDLTISGWKRVDGILFERLGLTACRCQIGLQTYLAVERVRSEGPAAGIGLQRDDLLLAFLGAGESRAWRFQGEALLARYANGLEVGSDLGVEVVRDLNGNRVPEVSEILKGTLVVE